MYKSAQLLNLEKEYNDVCLRFEQIKAHIFKLDQEIALYRHAELQISENVAILKDENIVPNIAEFKKVRDELSKATNRLAVLIIDRNNHYGMMTRTEEHMKDIKAKIDAIQIIQMPKVLRGNFGQKKIT